MILRDCTPNSSGMDEVEEVNKYCWDLLLMKMCEDYDRVRSIV